MTFELNISTSFESPTVSFHPLVRGDRNFWAFSMIDEEVLAALKEAAAVILPQVFPEALYALIKALGKPVFPNYDFRFRFPGKGGQFLLFEALGLPCPRAFWMPKIAALGPHPETRPVTWPAYPFVIKADGEHEGRGVFLIQNEKDLQVALKHLKTLEREGRFGFLVQEYLKSPFDLRVVVIGRKRLTFWRKLGDDFRSNLVQGGELISCPDEKLEREALSLVAKLTEKTGINLAAIDFLFRRNLPLLNEINYVFGRRALGDKYEGLLFEAILEFLERIPAQETRS